MLTHQEKLAFIRAKCIEANSEIVELKFGCKTGVGIYVGQTDPEEHFGDHHFVSETDVSGYIEDEGFSMESVEGLKIIGRPIRLADVLLAMGKTQKPFTPFTIAIACDGTFFNPETGENYTDGRFAKSLKDAVEMRRRWNLRKDDLNEQDEALVSFLYDVLR